jgi:hypothetical protein
MPGFVSSGTSYIYDTYVIPCHFHVPIFLISGSLNLLEHSGPVMGLLYLLPYI